ncbi:MAG TPA: hypothetical protein VEZ24_09190 [Microvirga sp.]|nr:hypothetical protein [Microvirga sp.]
MIVQYDAEGRYIAHLEDGYPARPEVLEKVTQDTNLGAVDVPPFSHEWWYFPDGVPTIRPRLDYTISERQEGDDKVTVISGIPAGTKVNVQGPDYGQSIESDGDDLELVLRIPGDYMIAFDAFPYQPVSIFLQVTAAEA